MNERKQPPPATQAAVKKLLEKPSRSPMDREPERTRESRRFLRALNRTSERVYEGTVPLAVKQDRRKKNRQARKSRARNRRS